MPKYLVSKREVHIYYVEVEADSPTEALSAVADGHGEPMGFTEYSHPLDPETWSVEEVTKNGPNINGAQ